MVAGAKQQYKEYVTELAQLASAVSTGLFDLASCTDHEDVLSLFFRDILIIRTQLLILDQIHLRRGVARSD
jgi:hypothetical protein